MSSNFAVPAPVTVTFLALSAPLNSAPPSVLSADAVSSNSNVSSHSGMPVIVFTTSGPYTVGFTW